MSSVVSTWYRGLFMTRRHCNKPPGFRQRKHALTGQTRYATRCGSPISVNIIVQFFMISCDKTPASAIVRLRDPAPTGVHTRHRPMFERRPSKHLGVTSRCGQSSSILDRDLSGNHLPSVTNTATSKNRKIKTQDNKTKQKRPNSKING